MAKTLRNMMGAGLGAQTAKLINGVVFDSLTATGSTQADALALSGDVNVVSSVPSGAGVLLPIVPQPGDETIVANLGANDLNVYPAVGCTLQGALANSPYSLLAGATAAFIARKGSQNWIVLSGGGSIVPALGIPVPTGAARFLDSGDGTGVAVTAPRVRQWLYIDPGPFTNTPTSYDCQIFADGALVDGGPFAAPGDFAFEVTDDLATTQLQVKCHGINGAGTSLTTSDSAPTTAVAAMSAAGGITLATRTSVSGVTPPVVQLTFDLSKALPGDSVRVRESTDGTFSGADVVQSVVHFLTSADLAAMPVVLDFVSDGFATPGATSFLEYSLEMTSPHGAFLSYTYPTLIPITDAVSPMVLSASDKAAGISLQNGNLFAVQNSAPGGGRASRGVSSGKFYVEWVAATAQINLYDGSASLTVDQEAAANGGTPSTHAAVFSSNNGTINYNATSAVVSTFGGAVFIAGISGTVMTVSNAIIGTLAVGQYIAGPGITWGTKINSLGTGAGGNGTYNVNISQTVVDDGTVQVSGPLIGMAVDATADKIAWAINNAWQNSANPSAGTGMLSISGISKPVFPAYNLISNGYRLGFFPGTTPGTTTGFVFTPPTGFLAP